MSAPLGSPHSHFPVSPHARHMHTRMPACDVASIGSAASAGWNLSALHSSFFAQLIGVFHRRASARRLMVSRSDSMHRLGDYCASLLQRLMCPAFCALICPVKCSERIWRRPFFPLKHATLEICPLWHHIQAVGQLHPLRWRVWSLQWKIKIR